MKVRKILEKPSKRIIECIRCYLGTTRLEAGGGGGSFEERSKSADGRLNAGFKRRDPKLSQFRSSSAASTENLAAAGAHLLNEVVTDQVKLTFKSLFSPSR